MSERDQAPGHADGTVPGGWHGLDGTAAGDAPGTRPMSVSQDGWAAVDGGPDATTGPMPPEGWQAEGQPTGRVAGTPDVHWNTHPTPPPPPPPPPPPGPFVPPPGQRPARRKGPLIALAAAATVLVAGVVTAVVVAVDGDDDDSSALTTADRTQDGSSEGAAQPPSPCASPPEIIVTGVDRQGSGLVLDTDITAACTDGDIIDTDSLRITVRSAGDVVAAGTIDLSSDPLILDGTESRSESLTLGSDNLLVPASMISTPLAVTAEVDATGPAVSDADARTALQLLRDQDRSSLDSEVWLPQISSKSTESYGDGFPSLVFQDIGRNQPWTYTMILDEHLQLRQQYPGARLVWSGDWPSFADQDNKFWVTVLASPQMSSTNAVKSWCSDEALSETHCAPRRLARK